MRLSYRPFRVDKTWQGWMWRALLGPAVLIDGIVLTMTLARFCPCLHITVSEKMGRATIAAMLKRREKEQKNEHNS